jgi:3,4-dihydroxy 2-butanone 4-phosphate synthase/GTP cyclohydrolase II
MLDSVDAVVRDIAAGKLVILVDDERRENEGDLVVAAECATPEAINFMATHGRGLICLALTGERIDALGLKPMVEQNTSRYETAFCTSFGVREGTTTGISAYDRSRAVLAAVNPATKPADLYSPGHVFPLRARDGGVLERAGHTEGAVELARLAGLQPAAVICEIMADDGHMARMPQLRAFARKHGLKTTSIDLLRAHLLKNQDVA